MKQFRFKIFAGFALLVSAFIVLSSFTDNRISQQESDPPSSQFEIPDDVSKIFENKCFDCHNVNSEGDKAKEKLLIDKMPELSKAKLISKLDAIAETMKEGEMPPEKFLAKYPEYTPTKEEADRLIEWANGAADDLLK